MLPASAGMILRLALMGIMGVRAPRIRGDDPLSNGEFQLYVMCSPHPRG